MTIFSTCPYPGCNELVEDGGRCKKHDKPSSNPSGKKDNSVLQMLNSRRYRNARKAWLKGKVCISCREQGRVIMATVLDHIVPHRGDEELFWDIDNWQPLCTSCHNRKTASYDGGFDNPRRG